MWCQLRHISVKIPRIQIYCRNFFMTDAWSDSWNKGESAVETSKMDGVTSC
jgi:hypothetical protein